LQKSHDIFEINGWIQNTVTIALQLENRVNSPIEFGIICFGAYTTQTVGVLVGCSRKTESHGNIELAVHVFNERLNGSVIAEQWVQVGKRVGS